MARVTGQQYLEKWGRRLSAAGPDITAGVNNVKTAPGVAAAAASDRMLAGIQASVQSGQWGKAVSAVSLTDWQNAMKNKGIPRLTQGVATAQQTKLPQITALLNAVDASVGALSSIPRGGIENNINRAVTFMREMSKNAPKRNK